ncbi:MAG: response regulator [Synergistaceae bacterium]|nr:response regulator [Synergistaceae bacterium]
MAVGLTSDIDDLVSENTKLRTENKRLMRELCHERNINERNRIISESRDNLSRVISAEKYRLEKYMDLLLANCPDIILFFDSDGRLVLASDSYMRSVEVSAFGMIKGKSYRELLSPIVDVEFLRFLDDMFFAVLKEKKSVEMDHDIDFGLKGNVRHYVIHAIPMIEESGTTDGAMLLFYDTTEITRAKFEAERARELAEQSARAKSYFLSRMSHEIRTPLNAIMGMAELLLRQDVPRSAREDVMGIKQAGDSLLTIINDILDFSKIESGKMEIIPSEYSLSSLVNDVISIVRMLVMEKPVQFVVNADASLPCKLIGDEFRVRQVLLNLLTNAAEYTSSGHIAFSIDAETREAEDAVIRFAISDTGIGIKEEDMEKLFIDFTQIDAYKNSVFEGIGLGLSIAQNLCRLMGGNIKAESVYGVGSTFTATIPQKIADETPLASVRGTREKSVLVYERRLVCADSIARSLNDLGVRYKVTDDQDEFNRELETGTYRFAFASQHACGDIEKRIAASASDTTFVLLSEFGGAPLTENVRTLTMPVYSAAIADVLNEDGSARGFCEGCGVSIDFSAPTARILIVDDIVTNLKVVSGLLAPYKIKTDCCGSGAEALVLIQKHHYDLALIDHMMPDMDGIETAAAIRLLPGEYFSKIPLVAFTANAMTGMKEMFLENGFNDYLTKPIEPSRLREVMSAWIPMEKRQQTEYTEAPRTNGILNGRYIEGIDMSAYKKRFYDEGSYIEILRTYCLHTPALLDKMREVTLETLKDYAVTVHGLKGSSYGIFAMTVARGAEILEHAAKSGDFEMVMANNASLIENTEKLLADLNELLADIHAQDAEKPVKRSPDEVLLKKILGASRKFLVDEMEEALTELERYKYKHGADLVTWLRGQVDNLEYEAIKDRLEESAG